MLKFLTNFLAGTRPLAVAGLLLLASALGWFSGNLWAANLQIQVAQKGKEFPLEEVSVCLGTSPNLKQFGAYLTDERGGVLFHEVQSAPFILTVSKPGFRGVQRIVGRQTLDRVMVVALAPGGGGPACEVSPQAKAPVLTAAELQVKDLAISRDAPLALDRKVTLSFTVAGEPSEYRASQFPDFRDAPWQTFVAKPQFKLSPGRGEKAVYLQLRRYREINGSYLQTVSNTARDSIYFPDR